MMEELLLKNCVVYDPIQGINGETMDIAIRNGRIVEKVSSGAKVIDVEKRIAVPGGIEMHTHIAGAKVNAARELRPEDHYRKVFTISKDVHSGSGYSLPSTKITGYLYTKMGYTTVMDAAVTPLKLWHTIEELQETPIVDKGFYVMFGNNWFVLDAIANDDFDFLRDFIHLILAKSGGYAIKIVNPGGVELWGWGKNVTNLDEPINNFGVSPKDIIINLMRVNKELNLPHTIHLHPNNLGHPGNFESTLETMDLDGQYTKRKMHITHLQFYSYGGSSWKDFESKSDVIAKYVNYHKEITIDIGQVIFNDTTTLTADGPLEYGLFRLTKSKWYNSDIEVESGGGVVPYKYSRKSVVNAVQWAIGLELALQIDDPWRIALTTDHPNGGPFFMYPEIISWLMNKKKRDNEIKKLPNAAIKKMLLPTLDREYTFSEIVTITRSGPTKVLGLPDRGTLKIGSIADIAIYDISPFETDFNQVDLEKKLQNTWATIKNGKIVYKDDKILDIDGNFIRASISLEDNVESKVISQIKQDFEKYYTIKLENYLRNITLKSSS